MVPCQSAEAGGRPVRGKAQPDEGGQGARQGRMNIAAAGSGANAPRAGKERQRQQGRRKWQWRKCATIKSGRPEGRKWCPRKRIARNRDPKRRRVKIKSRG